MDKESSSNTAAREREKEPKQEMNNSARVNRVSRHADMERHGTWDGRRRVGGEDDSHQGPIHTKAGQDGHRTSNGARRSKARQQNASQATK